jgi:hypothetical protein
MKKVLNGGCLCGAVKFELEDRFKAFYLCHCKQCQQLTGSAFASNIFTDPENISWLKGKESVSVYEHPSREFSKAFCVHCGSAVPFVNKSGKSLIVPAGSLTDTPSIVPQANIFDKERAYWLNKGLQSEAFNDFPE